METKMNDMASTIVARSDQINAADLLGQPRTLRIVSVDVRPGTEQPVSIKIAGDDKVFRPCKSMCRLLVAAWGADSAAYAGRSMTVYNDPDVLWAGMKVGGIRISHMSNLDGPLTLALAENKKNRKPFTVKPLVIAKAEPAATKPAATLEARLGSFIAALNKTADRAALVALQHRAEALIADVTASGPALFEVLTEAIAKRDATFETPEFEDGE
jgi:hypothetical protein